ncbi:AAA family ATPase [Vallitalea sediminicola]
MRIEKLKLQNYRGFDKFTLNIPDDYAVIIGDNGSGKTAILEAICICLGTILVGFDGVNSIGIKKDDVRLEYFPLGSLGNLQPQYPINISCNMRVNSQLFNFSRSINKPGGSTTRTDAKKIISYFNGVDKKVKKGANDIVLPLISYYSTGRLWLHSSKSKKTSRNKFDIKIKEETTNYQFNRLNGYIDCLSAKTNEKLMLKWFENMEYIEFQRKMDLPELGIVKQAIVEFFLNSLDYKVDFGMIDIDFDPVLNQLVIEYPDNEGKKIRLPFGMLSDGYKTMLSLVADIAYRMATLNPNLLERALSETKGIVVIDEIDMHLHPKWQRHVIEDLRNIFPNLQFIFTTHSEHVISNVSQEHIIKIGPKGVMYKVPFTKGRDINSLTSEVMDLPVREKNAQELINSFYSKIDNKSIDKAKIILDKMIEMFGEKDTEVIKANTEYTLEVE